MSNTENKPSSTFKAVRIIEIVLWAVIAVSLIFKILKWPGSGALTILGLGTLMMLYFVAWQAALGNRKNMLSNVYPRLVSFSLSISLVGILFRYLMWPGGTFQVVGGLVLCSILLLVGLAFMFLAKDKIEPGVLKWSLSRLVPIMVPLLFFFFVGKTDYYRMVGTFADNPQFMSLYEDCIEHGENCETFRAYRDSTERAYYDPKNIARRQIEEEERQQEQGE